MKPEHIRNCLRGWVQRRRELGPRIAELEKVLEMEKEKAYLSDFGHGLYNRMLEANRAEEAHCKRKIRWLLQEHDKITGAKRFQLPVNKYPIDKDAVKSRVDLVAFINQYTPLKKAGRNWKGVCPIHKEKTPSFYVRPDKGWYCHGHHSGGDIFKFVMEAENCSFREAVERVGGQL